MEKTAIVVLNYNGKSYLEKFLPFVIQYSQGHRIIVADNCSTDDSVAFLDQHFPEISVLPLAENYGYSQGYNAALAQVDAEYFVLLNSDVEVTPYWIDRMIDLLDSAPNIAAVQPKILDYNQRSRFEYAGAAGGYIDTLGYPFCRGRIFEHLEEDQGQYNDDREIFWATGACLLVRANLFKELGGFDPDFFAHMEEIDLCWRLQNYGYKIMYCGESAVYHVGGGTLSKNNPWKTYLNFSNNLTLLYKNYSSRELWLKLPMRVILDLLAVVKFLMGSPRDAWAVVRALSAFFFSLGVHRRKRKSTQAFTKMINRKNIYPGSIVYDHYLRRVKKFSQLRF